MTYRNEFYLAEILIQRLKDESSEEMQDRVEKITHAIEAERFMLYNGHILTCFNLSVGENKKLLDIEAKIRQDIGALVPSNTNIRIYRELIETYESGSDDRFYSWASHSADARPPRKAYYLKWLQPPNDEA